MLLRVIRSATTYQLLDQGGRPIGTVTQPTSDAVVGRGAGTVLLTRAAPRRQRPTSPPFRRISGAVRTISVPAAPTTARAEPAA